MIDEKKLIEEILEHKDKVKACDKRVNEVYELAHDHIIDIINMQPKADWIPYTTNGELPYNGQKVWLSFTNEICSYVKQAWWIYDHFEWNNGKRVKDCPIAWQPFIDPQPYKKEGGLDE